LLREITRSTRSSGGAAAQSGPKDDTLRSTVAALEHRVAELEAKLAETTNELKGRVDLIVMELAASRQHQQAMIAQMAMGAVPSGLLQAVPSVAASTGAPAPGSLGDAAACTLQNVAQKSFGSSGTWEGGQPPLGADLARAFSVASARSGLARALSTASAAQRALSEAKSASEEAKGEKATTGAGTTGEEESAPEGAKNAATLPPHPKQKTPKLPSIGAQTQAQTATTGSDAAMALRNSLMIRNAWESDFFNNLMMADGASRAASMAAGLTPTAALGAPGGLSALAAAQQQMGYSPYFQPRVNSMQSIMGVGGGLFPPGMPIARDASMSGLAAAGLNFVSAGAGAGVNTAGATKEEQV
jgi:hypothetical protein